MDSLADSSVQPTFKHLLDTSPGGAEKDEAATPPLAQSHGNRQRVQDAGRQGWEETDREMWE